ncbi:hypothetical protein EA459_04300 [Streptococcus dysgalactiae subsp. dysgalactiae]|nr:hypothetical protein [Streptococcus dysgalactiae]QGG97917.1 hypothetical protein EA459_04300 [Streptococcus dysgalactiae subsp. dysgalactiae]
MKSFKKTIAIFIALVAFWITSFGVSVKAEEQNSVVSEAVVFVPEGTITEDSDGLQNYSRSISGPVWHTESFTVTNKGRKVTAVWKLKANATIRKVNAVYNTGILGQTTSAGSYSPNSGGVTISQTWTYKKGGTFRINGVAQIYTSKGNASCFSPVRVVSFK